MKKIIICVEKDEERLSELKKQIKVAANSNYKIESFLEGLAALQRLTKIIEEKKEIPLLITYYKLADILGDELLLKIHQQSPMTKNILLINKEDISHAIQHTLDTAFYRYLVIPWHEHDLYLTIREALKSYDQEKDLKERQAELEEERLKVQRERKVIDTLSRILTDKIEETEKQRAELEEVSKELNITTVEKYLIEQEAEKLSQRLSSLQNNLKNNLFIRSILHTLVNMLQIQFSIDKKEDSILEELNQLSQNWQANNKQLSFAELNILFTELLPALNQQREQTEINIHRLLTGYVKAVQRSLLGQSVYYSPCPTPLFPILNRVLQKYKEILVSYKINFQTEVHSEELALCVYDFVLISILENLLTNSIRKVLETKNENKWIKLKTFEERIKTETYIILSWQDNGKGVEPSRKTSIFCGDSDKTEEGDHGIGLSEIKNAVESVGGFIKEIGEYGKGANFILAFPKVEKNSDKELSNQLV